MASATVHAAVLALAMGSGGCGRVVAESDSDAGFRHATVESGADGSTRRSIDSSAGSADAGKDSAAYIGKDTGADARKDVGKEAGSDAAKETGSVGSKDTGADANDCTIDGGKCGGGRMHALSSCLSAWFDHGRM
jgi:hypothetical protein